jgi:hypothetical protein
VEFNLSPWSHDNIISSLVLLWGMQLLCNSPLEQDGNSTSCMLSSLYVKSNKRTAAFNEWQRIGICSWWLIVRQTISIASIIYIFLWKAELLAIYWSHFLCFSYKMYWLLTCSRHVFNSDTTNLSLSNNQSYNLQFVSKCNNI